MIKERLSLAKGKDDPLIRKLEDLLPKSFARLADVYLENGKHQKALEILEKYAERFPGYPTGFWLLGKINYLLGDKDKALNYLQRTLQIIPEHLAALELAGKIYMENGEQAIARSYLKQVSQIDRLGNVAFRTQSDLDRKAPKDGVKRPDGKEIVSLELTGKEFATETMVKLYLKQGHKRLARELCQEILVRQPENNRIKMILEELQG